MKEIIDFSLSLPLSLFLSSLSSLHPSFIHSFIHIHIDLKREILEHMVKLERDKSVDDSRAFHRPLSRSVALFTFHLFLLDDFILYFLRSSSAPIDSIVSIN